MITTVILLVWLHFVADFIMQTDQMALQKSQSNKWLLIHIAVYSLPFFTFGIKYALVNAGLHLVTDFFSSRTTSFLWKKQQRHWFFVVIGLDQAVHMSCLFFTVGMIR